MNWFLSNFKQEDDVILVLYYPDKEAEKDVTKTIEELGYDIDKIPDILLYSNSLSESKIPSFVAAVDKVIDFGSSPFSIWARYLQKEIVEINNDNED